MNRENAMPSRRLGQPKATYRFQTPMAGDEGLTDRRNEC